MQDYTGIAYPYPKLDFALLPPFQYGGMEHPGSIFYKESSLMLDPSASVNERLSRAGLISHEVAHMWFGNLVTMKWFNDVWLKEVFANFMAARMVNPDFPQINHRLRFLLSHYPSAYEIDRSGGAHPVQQPLENLRLAGTIYGAIIYQKAPVMMRNLEMLMGEKAFQNGLKDYLNSYRYGNAGWDDLIGSLEKFTDQDLDQWNRDWIKRPGRPEISYRKDKDKIVFEVVNDTGRMYWPQQFRVITSGKEEIENFTVKTAKTPFEVQVSQANNKFVFPNADGSGYGYFRLNPDDLERLASMVNDFQDPEQRAAALMSLWEEVLNGQLEPEQFFVTLTKTLKNETDPLILDYVSGRTGDVYWKLLDESVRISKAAGLEKLLWDRFSKEKDISLKRTLFGLYRSVVLTEVGEEKLMKIWAGKTDAGFPLSENDFIQLAAAIALREIPKADSVLKVQMDRIKNPDRKSQMAFTLPALSSDTAVRQGFFEKIKTADARVREPWVLEGLRYLHHPLRTQQSVRFIRPSLELLEEVQLTGDIFFPKGWLDATLVNHHNPEAGQALENYLSAKQELPDYLRRKVLQSADMMKRAIKIHGQK
jgi:aminopeptidase N